MYCKYKGDCESKRLRSELKVCELEPYCDKTAHCVLEPIVICKYRTKVNKLSKKLLIEKVIKLFIISIISIFIMYTISSYIIKNSNISITVKVS